MNRHILGPVSSKEVIRKTEELEAKKSEYALSELEGNGVKKEIEAEKIESEYALETMRDFRSVLSNPAYQKEPTPVTNNQPVTAPNTGHPISAAELKKRIESLDNVVYAPSIVDGKLYFVSVENDVITAKRSDSHFSEIGGSQGAVENGQGLAGKTFTIGQLNQVLGQENVNNLIANQQTLTSTNDIRTAVSSTLITGQETSDPCHTANGSRTSMTTACFTALSSTIRTGNETSDVCRTAGSTSQPNILATSCTTASEPTLTARAISETNPTSASDSARTARSIPSMTDVRTALLARSPGWSENSRTAILISDECNTARDILTAQDDIRTAVEPNEATTIGA